MTAQTTIILICIGLLAGVLSGFVGVGGGVIIVPALIYVLGFPQHLAQGTSLFILLLPVGILAVFNYSQSGNINWKFGLIVAFSFVVGGFFGSKWALRIPPDWVKLIFGLIMAYVSIQLIYTGFNSIMSDES